MQAKLLENMNLHSQAIEQYDKALEMDSEFANAAYAKAACEQIVGRTEDAIDTYNFALAIDSQERKSMTRRRPSD